MKIANKIDENCGLGRGPISGRLEDSLTGYLGNRFLVITDQGNTLFSRVSVFSGFWEGVNCGFGWVLGGVYGLYGCIWVIGVIWVLVGDWV